MRGDITACVSVESCEDCGAPAVVRMQGETDSMGCEYAFLCQACADMAKAADHAYYAGLDVEDRPGSFLVSGCFNHDDGSDGWCTAFHSFRRATAYLRKQQRRAEPRGGIYPASSDCVQERADAFEVARRFFDRQLSEADEYFAR